MFLSNNSNTVITQRILIIHFLCTINTRVTERWFSEYVADITSLSMFSSHNDNDIDPVLSATVSSCTIPVETGRTGAIATIFALILTMAPSPVSSTDTIVTSLTVAIFNLAKSIFLGDGAITVD